ncbi:hypothetical protein ACH5RR_030679 [Cinchona calisaya]|uniref:Uncharacterized protein n=1 Tax=Cinchona calisaya TaxID=153742 RepID=A0ABD2Z0G2_9GENT
MDPTQPSYTEGPGWKNELSVSKQQKDDQSEDNPGTNVDESQELGCGSSSVSILSIGQLMPERNLSATPSEHAFVHGPLTLFHQCSPKANDVLLHKSAMLN